MKKKQRIDITSDREPLTASPFAGLGGLAADLPPGPEPEVQPPQKSPVRAWNVGKTRKGGYPLSIEKRAAGKSVTIVGNVEGDAKALLGELKRRCGAGGAVRGDTIEIQGDHRAAIEAFLKSG